MSDIKLLQTDRTAVRKAFGKSEKDVQLDIEILKKWLKTQPHLPETPNDTMIEMFLATNKFSVERTKEKLDMYYTIRTLIPEVYENSNPKSPRMKDVSDMVTFVALPKPTKEHYRVFIAKIKGAVEDFDSYKFFAHALNLIEVRLQHDIALGDVYIFDHEYLKVGHVLKLTPIHLKKIVTIFEKVFSNRIKGIYAINYPAYVDMLMTIFKATAKPKLVNRVKFFPNIEDMYEFVPREILPRDYGGEEVSVSELEDLWRKEMENHSERFDKLETMKVREELRPVPLKNDEVLGYHGNFKKLDVD